MPCSVVKGEADTSCREAIRLLAALSK